MKKYLMVFLLIFMLLPILVACGTGGPSTNLRIDMTDFMYSPADIIVPTGKEITLELVNNGAVVHSFIIMDFGAEVGDNFGDEDETNIYWKAELGPGETETYTFTAPGEPGDYQIVCGVAGHYTAGMVGSLTVVSE